MIEQGSAPAGRAGAGDGTITRAAFLSVVPHCTTRPTELSRLIRQATARAYADRQRAEFYERRSRRHTRILVELRRLSEVRP